MSDESLFAEQLTALENILLDPASNNRDIILSHALELLAAYSTLPAFASVVADRRGLLGCVLGALEGPPACKALLLLVNLAAQSLLVPVLLSLGAIDRLLRCMLDAAKRVSARGSHVPQSLLVQNARDSDALELELSSANISATERSAVELSERVRLSLLVASNLARADSNARFALAGPPPHDFATVLLFATWLRTRETVALVEHLPLLLLALSEGEELRGRMIEACGTALVGALRANAGLSSIAQISLWQTLRNFSFAEESTKMWELFRNEKVMTLGAQRLRELKGSDCDVELARTLIDTCLALLTAERADAHPWLREELKSVGMATTVAEIRGKMDEAGCDRCDALENLLQE